MSAYHVWNPYIPLDEPQVVELVITRADADAIGNGTNEFAAGILKDIGLEAPVKHWNIEGCRSQYYSEYLNGSDWRDTWQIIWKMRVVTTKKLARLPKHRVPWIETNATDASWSSAKRVDDRSELCCLIVSDFRSESALKKAWTVVTEDDLLSQMRKQHSAPVPTFSRSQVLGRYPQLQINIGMFAVDFFASGAAYAERFLELCRDASGTTNFQDRGV